MTRRRFAQRVCVLCLVMLAVRAGAQERWTFELCGTVPYNVPLPLTIRQSGQPDINLTGRYSSKPFVTPVCWVWRIGRWSNQRSWELQAVHQKLYLDNRPPEVGSFSVSHGLNLVTINRGWLLDEYMVRGGAGIVLAHPEGTVRGKSLSEDRGILGMGYYVSGPVVMIGTARRFRLVGELFLDLEVMSALSCSDVPIADGDARVYNLVVQVNFGLGCSVDR